MGSLCPFPLSQSICLYIPLSLLPTPTFLISLLLSPVSFSLHPLLSLLPPTCLPFLLPSSLTPFSLCALFLAHSLSPSLPIFFILSFHLSFTLSPSHLLSLFPSFFLFFHSSALLSLSFFQLPAWISFHHSLSFTPPPSFPFFVISFLSFTVNLKYTRYSILTVYCIDTVYIVIV